MDVKFAINILRGVIPCGFSTLKIETAFLIFSKSV